MPNTVLRALLHYRSIAQPHETGVTVTHNLQVRKMRLGVTGLVRGEAEIRPRIYWTLSYWRSSVPPELLQGQPISSGGRVREKRTEQRGTSAEQRGPEFPGAH